MEAEVFLQVSLGVSKDREIQLITALTGVVDALYCLDELTHDQARELIRVGDFIQARLIADANKSLSKP